MNHNGMRDQRRGCDCGDEPRSSPGRARTCCSGQAQFRRCAGARSRWSAASVKVRVIGWGGWLVAAPPTASRAAQMLLASVSVQVRDRGHRSSATVIPSAAAAASSAPSPATRTTFGSRTRSAAARWTASYPRS